MGVRLAGPCQIGIVSVSHILWLASYPKSGNTWLRAFLANFLLNPTKPFPINELAKFGYGDMEAYPYQKVLGHSVDGAPVEKIYAIRPQAHRIIADMKPGIVMVKTHNRLSQFNGIPTITPGVTFGAIYIIRNPLDVMISIAEHYGIGIDDAIEASGSSINFIPPVKGLIPQDVGDWSGHVRSWTRAPGLFLQVMRYEDMISQTTKSFAKVVDFLGTPKNPARLKKAIRFSSFKELSSQEKRNGFLEASRNSERFFRKGKSGQWRKRLTPRQVEKVVELHGETMTEFGYLDKNGAPKE